MRMRYHPYCIASCIPPSIATGVSETDSETSADTATRAGKKEATFKKIPYAPIFSSLLPVFRRFSVHDVYVQLIVGNFDPVFFKYF